VAIAAGKATKVSAIGIVLFIALIPAGPITGTSYWLYKKIAKAISLSCPLLVLGYSKLA
jgi:hypothetical protein